VVTRQGTEDGRLERQRNHALGVGDDGVLDEGENDVGVAEAEVDVDGLHVVQRRKTPIRASRELSDGKDCQGTDDGPGGRRLATGMSLKEKKRPDPEGDPGDHHHEGGWSEDLQHVEARLAIEDKGHAETTIGTWKTWRHLDKNSPEEVVEREESTQKVENLKEGSSMGPILTAESQFGL